MKSSLFKKLFGTASLIILISMIVFSVMIFGVFKSYFIENRVSLIVEQGEKIAEEIEKVFITGTLDSKAINQEIQTLDKFLDARIWIVNVNDKISAVSTIEDQNLYGREVLLEKKGALIAGETQVYNNSFDKLLNFETLTIACPIRLGNQYAGAVLIHSEMEEISGAARSIFKNILMILLITMFLLYIVLYLSVKKITSPLAEISEAAKVISGGEFQKRLYINTKDEIQELSHSFNEMAESLEKIEENRRHFISNISHDLRSPMTCIRGFIEGILDGTIPEDKQHYYLNIVLDESKRMMKITNDILELNNMQQGIMMANKTKFDICELIRRTLLTFESRIIKKKINVEVFWSQEESIMVESDLGFIERVLSNLLDNAVKFTPEKESIIIRVEEEKLQVLISVINTGVTMESQELHKMWERFHKGDQSRGIDKSGFGLGLSIVREVMNLLEETIHVNSEDNTVTFSFTIKKS